MFKLKPRTSHGSFVQLNVSEAEKMIQQVNGAVESRVTRTDKRKLVVNRKC